jgi:hypothetical protein
LLLRTRNLEETKNDICLQGGDFVICPICENEIKSNDDLIKEKRKEIVNDKELKGISMVCSSCEIFEVSFTYAVMVII